MTVVLDRLSDINLETYRRVAWRGEGVRLSPKALRTIADCRTSFLQLIDNDPDLVIYGVTTAMGERASHRLSQAERQRHARLKPLAPGLTPRAVLDKFAAVQMLDVHFPTTDGRTLILSR